jgi:hypothetical protein
VPICAASAAASTSTVASSAAGEPAAASTAAGPTVNQALPGASSRRPALIRRWSTSGTRETTMPAAIATGTSQAGSRNRLGTSASCTGAVQAYRRSNRARWATAISATVSATIAGSAERSLGPNT